MSFTSESQQPARTRKRATRATDSDKTSLRAIRRNAERAARAAQCEAEMTVINAKRNFAQASKTDNKHKVHNTMPARTYVAESQIDESRLSRSHKTLAPARTRNNDEHVVLCAVDASQAKINSSRQVDLEMLRAERARMRAAGEIT